MGMPPVGSSHEVPPFAPIREVDWFFRLYKYDRPRIEQFWEGAGIGRSFRWGFRHCPVSGFRYEGIELCVGHRVRIHPESADSHDQGWSLFRIVTVGAHQRRTAGYADHTFCGPRVIGQICRGHLALLQVDIDTLETTSKRERRFIVPHWGIWIHADIERCTREYSCDRPLQSSLTDETIVYG